MASVLSFFPHFLPYVNELVPDRRLIYRYFGDKAGLQQAVGEVVLSQMQRRIQEAAQSAQTPRDSTK